MLDMHIGRCTGVLFQTLLCWTLIEHCSAGHRPYERWERPRYPRHNDRWTQRIEYPSVNDEGTQGLRYPSVHGRGQEIRYPSLSDSDASAQIKKCFPGYYRDESGPFLGQCVLCQCNGLADECEDKTGRCLNCKYNTAGDRCERCKEGYYGNAAQRTCTVCPCPLSVPTNSFAIGCREVFDDFQCICRAGYTGDKCQSCAPGYFGDPLTVGGKCQPCNCNGNGNSCDPKTGVCKNALEPGDTDTDNQCQECDNCAQTLLNDLEKLDDELERVKAQLGNVTASASSQDRLKKLEKAVADTKVLVKTFSTFINNQKDKVTQLDEDTQSLSDDISGLKNKAEKEAADADKAVSDVGKTHKRAKELDSEIQKTLKKIQDLLDHLKDAGTTGGVVPSENLAKMLADAERMVKEMENRNFTPQKNATVKEREEAKKLLDYIKTNVSKQFDENNATAERIRDLLKGYEAKLKDLDQALKEAKDLVKKANAQNGLNAQAMADMQKRIENLKAEQKTVKDQMAMADDELQKTKDLVKMLGDSKTEYERLAAQLHGAKTALKKKVNDISKAAAKENIVEAAEAHAKTLNQLAKELEDSVKNASGRPEVRNAKDAIDAYKNITDAINAAELAANETKNATDKALEGIKNQQLPERTKYLKDTSEDLIRNAHEANRNLKSAAGDLNNLKKRLNNADKKKNALQKDLLDVQKELGGINRDDIADMIEDAKKKAASANGTASDTMDKLNDIKKEIEKINVTPASSNLSNLLDNVDQSVKNLLKTIPNLSDKLTEVENLTSQFSPVSNITENIKKIKELIELARDAANRVAVPMKFSGSSHVELRPPQNVDDLKAYTSMILSLQRPKDRGDGKRRRRQAKENADMFVLYLGNRDTTKNYFGMVLKNNVLYGVYKLNGQEYEMQTGSITKSDPEPATFDKVELHRIYQDAKMVLTNDITSNEPSVPIESSMQGEVDKNLLDLSPSDIVFYVGGYPANFTPPKSLNLPMYKGCIEFSSFNDKVTSLYNFLNAEKINLQTPCKRYVSPVDSDYYEGTGYSKVDIDKKNTFLFISMSVYSRSENGLLLYIGTEDNYFTVTTEQGVIFLRSNLLENPVYNSNTKSFPTDDWVEIQVISTNQGKMTVRISGKDVAVAQAAYRNDHFKEYYVGGAPRELRERHNITMQPFKGCLKNLKLNKATKLVAEQVGVSKGCPRASLVSRKAEFKSQSALSSDLKGFSLDNDVVSLGFKTKQSRGLILRNKLLDNGINIALENGHVILNSNDKSWKSNKQYNDDQWHYLTVTRRTGRTELLVDDDDQGQEQSRSSIPDTGGVLILGNNDFQGCMSNLYTRRPNSLHKAEDFSSFQASGAVLLDVCTADSLAQLMLDRNSKKDSMMQATNESQSACVLPPMVRHAYRMYGSVSSLSYGLPLQVLQPRPHFSLDIRTRAPEGLLFFAATRGGRAHLALYISKGRIRLSVGKEKEIFNREKYNDGKWHSVMFSLEKKKFRLVVDGIRAQDGQLTNSEVTSMQHFVSPVYLGSVPEVFHKELKLKALPKQSVSGCIRNFKMNGAPMINPTTNHGAGPCFEGQALRGAYFSGNGAHVIINDSFVVGSSFELLFSIRPRNPTGLLLHVGDSGRNQYGPAMDHYISVYMLRGEVVARVNNGDGEFMVAVKPKASLCDGMFHKISVIKRKNVVQLHVDTIDSYKIGPPSSTMSLTKTSLYVGGIPEMLMRHLHPVTTSFVGCIQDMTINSEPVAFERLPRVFGPVNLRECPG